MRLEIKVLTLKEKRFKHGIEKRGKEPCIVIKSTYIEFPFKIRWGGAHECMCASYLCPLGVARSMTS